MSSIVRLWISSSRKGKPDLNDFSRRDVPRSWWRRVRKKCRHTGGSVEAFLRTLDPQEIGADRDKNRSDQGIASL